MSNTKPISEGDTLLCDAPVNAEMPFNPDWEKFLASLHDRTGRVVPNQTDPRWRQYFNLWAIGYVSALRDVLHYSSKQNENKLPPKSV
jgi:hypothetical protein